MLTTLEKIGIVCISVVSFKILNTLLPWIYNSFISPLIISNLKFREIGKWALITGATDGVGKAYAEALAAEGMDIILISRSTAKLEIVAAEIEREYKVQTKIIEADFTAGPDIYENIEKHIHNLEIGVLINNVGLSYQYPEYFLDLPDRDQAYGNIIQCNVVSVTNMCKLVMPGMLERGKGVVVNVSSTAALIPSPLLAVYAASKAYIEKFSADLYSEYKHKGIVIQCLSPGFIATKMSKITSSTWMAPSPKKFVGHALQTIGKQAHTTGYYPHSLLVAVITTLEAICPPGAVWLVTSTMKNIRARALRRYVN